MNTKRIRHSRRRGSYRGLAVSAVVLALAGTGGLAGCRPTRAAAPGSVTAPAAFTPEGQWRSSKLGVMTVHLQPGGSLLMIDPHGGKHPFPRVGPDHWQARISREVIGTIDREGDQLVFRTQPTPEAQKPIAQKNGVMLVHNAKSIEDRMTRVPETVPSNKARK